MPKRKRKQDPDDLAFQPSSSANQSIPPSQRRKTRRSTKRATHLSSFNELLSYIKLFSTRHYVLTMEDFLRTQPEQYLSDAIINHEIAKLREKYKERDDVFIAECGVWSVLEAGHTDRVARNYFKGVELSKKRFILIPVHRVNHWSLAVVHLHDLNFAWGKKSRGNAIIMCDSLSDNFSYSGMGRHLRKFLDVRLRRELQNSEGVAHAWSGFVEGDPRVISGKEFPVKHARLPQQQNATDCGLFVVRYIEEYLKADAAALPLLNQKELFSGEDMVLQRLQMHNDYATLLDTVRTENPEIMQLIDKVLNAENECAGADMEQQLRQLMVQRGWISEISPLAVQEESNPISYVTEDGAIVLD